jgi:hypothetical protein
MPAESGLTATDEMAQTEGGTPVFWVDNFRSQRKIEENRRRAAILHPSGKKSPPP